MKKRFLSLMVLGMAMGLVFMGCGDGAAGGGSSPQSLTCTSSDGAGNTYVLTITEKAAKAAYTAAAGDSYVLTITWKSSGEVKTSRGIVESVNGGSLGLKPSGGTTFTVTLVGENISSISGTITLDDGSTVSGLLTPSGVDLAKFQGDWVVTLSNEISYHFIITGTAGKMFGSGNVTFAGIFVVNETDKKLTLDDPNQDPTYSKTGVYAFEGDDKFVLSNFGPMFDGTYTRNSGPELAKFQGNWAHTISGSGVNWHYNITGNYLDMTEDSEQKQILAAISVDETAKKLTLFIPPNHLRTGTYVFEGNNKFVLSGTGGGDDGTYTK
ncbi:hypothetical protein AGMMS49546_37940 [Spirochaetia bacterium]|nr:hypothetical protein AGMMS49546_37940 [Spirochaetia bacterium]